MSDPLFPDIKVELPPDATNHDIALKVVRALKDAGQKHAVKPYVQATQGFRKEPDAYLEEARRWVCLEEAPVVEAPVVVSPGSSCADLAILAEPVGSPNRWQYAIANVGMFRSPARMGEVLATAGAHGWELVTVYDKASNWLAGMEKGFMLLKRMVPEGTTPTQWCYVISQ